MSLDFCKFRRTVGFHLYYKSMLMACKWLRTRMAQPILVTPPYSSPTTFRPTEFVRGMVHNGYHAPRFKI